jgi:membrane-associated protease RseP (regulator of RpoE activity)
MIGLFAKRVALLLLAVGSTCWAHAGQLFGVGLRQYSIGIGKALVFRGRLRIRAFLLGGYVSFVDTRAESTSSIPLPMRSTRSSTSPRWSRH